MSDKHPDRPLPILTLDEDAERFLETADLSEYDLSAMRPFGAEFGMKDARVNMRLPSAQLEAVKAAAAADGIPYQRFIRNAIELALAARDRKAS